MNGYIEKRPSKDGKMGWRLKVFTGKNEFTGKYEYVYKSISSKANLTKNEAEKKLREFVVEVEKGNFIKNTGETLNSLIDKFLISKERSIRASTLTSHKINARHIKEAIGHIKIDKLDPGILDKFLSDLTKKKNKNTGGKLSTATQKNIYITLAGVLNFAEDRDFIIKNPIKRVKAPKIEKKAYRTFTLNEYHKILEYFSFTSSHYRNVIRLLWHTGIRRGEALALSWEDIDFNERTITISKSLSHNNKEFEVSETKTSNIRKVALNQEAINGLSDQWETFKKAAQVVGSDNCDFVFYNPDTIKDYSDKYGYFTPIIPKSFTRAWQRCTRKLNIVGTLHDIRHTNVTERIRLGESLPVISKSIGHAQISTTSDTYGHLDHEDARKGLDEFGEKFKSAAPVDKTTEKFLEYVERYKTEELVERNWKKITKFQKKIIIKNILGGNMENRVWASILNNPKYHKEVTKLNREILKETFEKMK